MTHRTMTLPATLQAVSNFTQELEAWFQPLPTEIRVRVVLAVQELCVNIVQHAYHGQPGEIRVIVDWTPSQLCLQFSDDAPNKLIMPQTLSAPDPLLLQENGMGLFLIHEAFDQVIYEPSHQQSHWRLLKQLEHEA